jgi:Tfp pilus assembly protein FimT
MSTVNLKKFRKQKTIILQGVDVIEMLTALVCIAILAVA